MSPVQTQIAAAKTLASIQARLSTRSSKVTKLLTAATLLSSFCAFSVFSSLPAGLGFSGLAMVLNFTLFAHERHLNLPKIRYRLSGPAADALRFGTVPTEAQVHLANIIRMAGDYEAAFTTYRTIIGLSTKAQALLVQTVLDAALYPHHPRFGGWKRYSDARQMQAVLLDSLPFKVRSLLCELDAAEQRIALVRPAP